MEVEPSRRIDLFSLGMPIGDAIACILKTCGQGNTLAYNPVAPASNRCPTFINVHQAKLKLYFSPDTQEIFKLTSSSPWATEIVLIQERDSIRICSPEEPLTFDQLKTFPLRLRQNIVRSPNRCQVVCNGICFTFDPGTLLLKEISIFYGGSDVKPIVPPPFSVYCPSGFYNLRYISLCRQSTKSPVIGLKAGLSSVIQRVGNKFESISLETDVEIENFERHILFGDSLQDVLTDFGAPEKSYYQEKPSRLLSRSNHHQLSDSVASGDLYLNYKSLGLDVVISKTSHKVIRIVLHSNFPGHHDFNLYRRCAFALDIHCCCHHIVGRRPQLNVIKHQVLKVKPIMKWSKIEEHVKCGDARHVAVLEHKVATNDQMAISTSDCYAFDQLVFEVMRNGHIATVTVLPEAPFKTCSSSDKNPHLLLSTASKTNPLDEAISATTGKAVAFHVDSGSAKSSKSTKSQHKSEIKVKPSFFVPLDDQNQCLDHDSDHMQAKHGANNKQNGHTDDISTKETANTEKTCDSQIVPGTHHFNPDDILLESNSINSNTSVTPPSKLNESHILPIEQPGLPAENVRIDEVLTSHVQCKETSVQAYHDGFAPHAELSRSPPRHSPIPSNNSEPLDYVTPIQQEQQQHEGHSTDVDIRDDKHISCLVESQADDEMFVSAIGSPDGMRLNWSTSAAPDPAVSSLSSLVLNSGKQDCMYVSWEDIAAGHPDVLSQLQRRAQAVKDIANAWVSGNPSRAVSMLYGPQENWLEPTTELEKNCRLQSSLAATDASAAFNLHGIFIANDSMFSIPVCIDLLPALIEYMETANPNFTPTSHLLEVFSVVSVITKKFGRIVVTSTPGTTAQSRQLHKEKVQCRQLLRQMKSQASSMLNDVRGSNSNPDLLKSLRSLTNDLTKIH